VRAGGGFGRQVAFLRSCPQAWGFLLQISQDRPQDFGDHGSAKTRVWLGRAEARRTVP
jgi:hypothetical protein